MAIEALEARMQRVLNVVGGYDWLGEGRGPYNYDDARYDDDVMAFVQELHGALEGQWGTEPTQTLLNQLHESKVTITSLRETLELVLVESDWLVVGTVEKIKAALTD